MEITILLGFNNSGKSTWMKEQKPDVWIKGVKNKFLLSDKENCLVAFENPECGLHPTLHADLVTLIIANAIRKNQNTIIETHSEVMLTRIRRLIACGNLDASNVNVYWFDGGNNIFRKYLLEVDNDGDIDTFDFFDAKFVELKSAIKKENIKELGELCAYFPDVFSQIDEDNNFKDRRKIKINNKGYFDYFPEGVFEECYKELLKISEIL